MPTACVKIDATLGEDFCGSLNHQRRRPHHSFGSGSTTILISKRRPTLTATIHMVGMLPTTFVPMDAALEEDFHMSLQHQRRKPQHSFGSGPNPISISGKRLTLVATVHMAETLPTAYV